jgi:hypothetical protein
MAVQENEGAAAEPSNAAVSGRRVVRYEKGAMDAELRFIDYGATALRREAVLALPDGPSGLDALQADLARRGVLRAHVVADRYFEIGSAAGLAALERHLAGAAP